MTTPTTPPVDATGRLSLRDTLAIARLRAARMTCLAGLALNLTARRRRRRELHGAPAGEKRPQREGFEIGDVVWPVFFGFQLLIAGSRKARHVYDGDAALTLTGDDDHEGRVGHPAARLLGGLVCAVQVVVISLLVASVWLAAWHQVALPRVVPVVVDGLIGVTLHVPAVVVWAAAAAAALFLIEGALTIVIGLRALAALHHRTVQLRRDGEAVCVLTSYVRRKNTHGAGQALARPVIDRLGHRRVIVLGNAANASLARSYLTLGAVHDSDNGEPRKDRRMRIDYPGRDATY